jgi:hypothetical protein
MTHKIRRISPMLLLFLSVLLLCFCPGCCSNTAMNLGGQHACFVPSRVMFDAGGNFAAEVDVYAGKSQSPQDICMGVVPRTWQGSRLVMANSNAFHKAARWQVGCQERDLAAQSNVAHKVLMVGDMVYRDPWLTRQAWRSHKEWYMYPATVRKRWLRPSLPGGFKIAEQFAVSATNGFPYSLDGTNYEMRLQLNTQWLDNDETFYPVWARVAQAVLILPAVAVDVVTFPLQLYLARHIHFF